MKILLRTFPLIAFACVGCGVSEISYYEHPPTHKFRKDSESHVSPEDFDESPQFVDAGILFVPIGRELAWKETHRVIINFYSKKPSSISIDRITISDEHRQRSITRRFNSLRPINTLQENSPIYRGLISAYFNEVDGAAEVLSHKTVIVVVHYQIQGEGELKKREFILKKKVKIGAAIFDTFAAA